MWCIHHHFLNLCFGFPNQQKTDKPGARGGVYLVTVKPPLLTPGRLNQQQIDKPGARGGVYPVTLTPPLITAVRLIT